MSEVDVRVGHLPDPYRLDVAYAGGRSLGIVEKIVMDEPNPDRLRPYIEDYLLREEILSVEAVHPDEVEAHI